MRHFAESPAIAAAFNRMFNGQSPFPGYLQVKDTNEIRLESHLGKQIFRQVEPDLNGIIRFRPTRPYYTCKAYQGQAFKELDGSSGFVHTIELSATTQWRIADWLESGSNEERQGNHADRMLNDLFDIFIVKENELVLSLLRKIVKMETRVTEFSDSLDLYAGVHRGRKMLHPMMPTPKLLPFFDAKATGRIIEYDDRAYGQSVPRLSFEFDPKEELGLWGIEEEGAKVFLWMNAEKLTFGLSAFMLRGLVITNPDTLTSIDFSACVQQSGKWKVPESLANKTE